MISLLTHLGVQDALLVTTAACISASAQYVAQHKYIRSGLHMGMIVRLHPAHRWIMLTPAAAQAAWVLSMRTSSPMS